MKKLKRLSAIFVAVCVACSMLCTVSAAADTAATGKCELVYGNASGTADGIMYEHNDVKGTGAMPTLTTVSDTDKGNVLKIAFGSSEKSIVVPFDRVVENEKIHFGFDVKIDSTGLNFHPTLFNIIKQSEIPTSHTGDDYGEAYGDDLTQFQPRLGASHAHFVRIYGGGGADESNGTSNGRFRFATNNGKFYVSGKTPPENAVEYSRSEAKAGNWFRLDMYVEKGASNFTVETFVNGENIFVTDGSVKKVNLDYGYSYGFKGVGIDGNTNASIFVDNFSTSIYSGDSFALRAIVDTVGQAFDTSLTSLNLGFSEYLTAVPTADNIAIVNAHTNEEVEFTLDASSKTDAKLTLTNGIAEGKYNVVLKNITGLKSTQTAPTVIYISDTGKAIYDEVRFFDFNGGELSIDGGASLELSTVEILYSAEVTDAEKASVSLVDSLSNSVDISVSTDENKLKVAIDDLLMPGESYTLTFTDSISSYSVPFTMSNDTSFGVIPANEVVINGSTASYDVTVMKNDDKAHSITIALAGYEDKGGSLKLKDIEVIPCDFTAEQILMQTYTATLTDLYTKGINVLKGFVVNEPELTVQSVVRTGMLELVFNENFDSYNDMAEGVHTSGTKNQDETVELSPYNHTWDKTKWFYNYERKARIGSENDGGARVADGVMEIWRKQRYMSGGLNSGASLILGTVENAKYEIQFDMANNINPTVRSGDVASAADVAFVFSAHKFGANSVNYCAGSTMFDIFKVKQDGKLYVVSYGADGKKTEAATSIVIADSTNQFKTFKIVYDNSNPSSGVKWDVYVEGALAGSGSDLRTSGGLTTSAVNGFAFTSFIPEDDPKNDPTVVLTGADPKNASYIDDITIIKR